MQRWVLHTAFCDDCSVCSPNVFVLFFFVVGHPNLAAYPEDWKESARIVALQKQDNWEDFTRERIQRSVERIASREFSFRFYVSYQVNNIY